MVANLTGLVGNVLTAFPLHHLIKQQTISTSLVSITRNSVRTAPAKLVVHDHHRLDLLNLSIGFEAEMEGVEASSTKLRYLSRKSRMKLT